MNYTVRRIACVIGFTLAFTAALLQPAVAQPITLPPMPDNIRVPPGYRPFLKGHAVGTQNYVCLPSGPSFAWTFFGPQATLFTDNNEQVFTHFLSANQFENGTARATWEHSRDTSTVWAMPVASSTDPIFVAPGAIPWLLLRVVGAQEGPTHGRTLMAAVFVQRLSTVGGVTPTTGCAQAEDLGKKALVPYRADYVFYKNRYSHDEGDDN